MVQTMMQQQGGTQGNGNVVALGVLQIIYGAAIMVAGLLVAVIGGSASAFIGKQFEQFGGETWGTLGAVMFVVVGLIVMMAGVVPLVSGIGLLKYHEWGRIMTFIMATLAGIGAILSLADLDIVGALVPGAFSAYAWVMLTRPHIVALFRRGQMQQTIVVETA